MATVVPRDGALTLVMPEGLTIPLPLRLPVAVSDDGRVVLQYGDALLGEHPVRTDIFWIGRQGEIVAEVRDRFDGNALVEISRDGFTAVAGADYFAARGSVDPGGPTLAREATDVPVRVELYDPAGERLWSLELPVGRRVDALLPITGGRAVAAITADREAPLQRRAVEIFSDGERRAALEADIGIVQRGVVVGETMALIQGTEGYALLDVGSGRMLWTRPERIRLVGPEAATLHGPTGRLHVVTGEPLGRRNETGSALYDWVLTTLDAETGEPLAQTRLAEPLPGAPGPVFLAVEADRVALLAGDQRMEFAVEL